MPRRTHPLLTPTRSLAKIECGNKREVNQIGRVKIQHLISCDLPDNWDWSTSDRITRRISQYCAKLGIQLPGSMLTQVGNIANDDECPIGTYYIRFAKKVNWHDGDYGDHNSCMWRNGKFSSAAQKFIAKYGYAALIYRRPAGWRRHRGALARAWVIQHPQGWVVTNGYGLQTRQIAKILSQHLKLKYSQMSFSINNGRCDLYVNGGNYLLANAMIENYTYRMHVPNKYNYNG